MLRHELVVEGVVEAETCPEVLERDQLQMLLGAIEEPDDPEGQSFGDEKVLCAERVSADEEAEHLDQVRDELALGERKVGHVLVVQVHQRLEKLLYGFVVKVLHEIVGAVRDGVVGPQARHVIAVGPRHGIYGLAVSHGVQQHLDGLGHLRLDAEVRLDEKELDESVGQRLLLLVDGLEELGSHEERVVVDEVDEDVGPRNANRRVGVLQGVGDDVEQPAVDEV
jgi:hypothetical protein